MMVHLQETSGNDERNLSYLKSHITARKFGYFEFLTLHGIVSVVAPCST